MTGSTIANNTISNLLNGNFRSFSCIAYFPINYPNIWSKKDVFAIIHQTKTEVDKVMPKKIRKILNLMWFLKRDFIAQTHMTSETKMAKSPIGPKNQLGIIGLFITENNNQKESIKIPKNIIMKKVMVHLVSFFPFSCISYFAINFSN